MFRPARINLRLLLISFVVLVALGGGVVGLRYYQKGAATSVALTEGKAAFANADWDTACNRLKRYLEDHPDDVDVLSMYGEARLSRRPLDVKQVSEAIAAYRRLLRLRPNDDDAFKRLTTVYWHARNFEDLAYVAKQRVEQNPDDYDAAVWLAKVDLNRGAKEVAARNLEALLKRIESKKVTSPAYVEACNWLSYLAAERATGQLTDESLAWLDKAVNHDPKSIEALARRARFYRMKAAAAPDRDALLEAARADLTRADAIQADDPRLDLVLCSEWIAHHDIARAEKHYQIANQASAEQLKRNLIQPDDWVALKYIHGAELARKKGDTEWGVKLADEALTALPGRSERAAVLPLVIETYLAAGKLDQAKQWLVDYLSVPSTPGDGPDTVETRAMVEAMVANAENRPYRVVELLEPFRERTPQRADVWKQLASAYSLTGQRGRAVDVLTKYLRREPGDAEALLALGREQLASRDFAAAAAVGEQLARVDAMKGEGALLSIEAAVQAIAANAPFAKKVDIGKLSESIAELRKLNPKLTDARIFQATLALREGRAADAVKELETAIHECDNTLPAELMLARLQAATGHADKAVATLKTAVGRGENIAAPYEVLASLLESQNDIDGAAKTLADGAAAVKSADVRSYLNTKLATLELRQGRRAEGLKRLKEMAAADPQETRARSLLLSQPEIVADGGVAQKLIDELKSAQGPSGLTWRLHQAALWLRGAEWRAKQRDIQESLNYCVDADPAWAAPALLLGELSERLGNLPQAEAVYRRALSLQPGAFDIASRLLELLEQQKRFNDARQVLDAVDASARWMSEQRVALSIHEGEFADAIDEMKQEIARAPENGAARVLLARLTYQDSKNAEAAMKLLDEAETLKADALAVAGARAAILHAEGNTEKAIQVLNAEVEHNPSMRSMLARAIFFESIGDKKQAEADYRALAEREKSVEATQLLAQYFIKNNQLDDAVATLDDAVKSTPDSQPLQRMLMTSLFARGKSDDRARAEKLLTKFSGEASDDPSLLWTRALLAMETGTPESLRNAEQDFKKLIELEPTAAEAYLRLIELVARRGDFAAARDLAIRGRGANPTNSKLLLARADAELQLGQTGSALELAQVALRESPGDPQALLVFANAATQAGENGAMKRALDALTAAKVEGAFVAPVAISRATLMDRLGQKDQAIGLLREAAKNDASSTDALVALAELFYQHGDLNAAGETLDEAEKRAATAYAVRRLRLQLLAQSGAWDQVEKFCAALDPRDASQTQLLVIGAGMLSNASGAHAKTAMGQFERVLTANPAAMEARLGLASAAYQTGDAARAETLYREALASDPANGRALNDLAWILAEATQKYDEALELASRGLRVASDDPHLHDTRAFILSKMPGRLPEARSEYERAAQLAPANSAARARALLKSAKICAELKDWTAARRWTQEATQLDERVHAFSPSEKQELQDLMKKAP